MHRRKPGKRRVWTFHGAKDFTSIFNCSLTHATTDERYEEERAERKKDKRRAERDRDRKEKDEYSDDGLEDWERGESRKPKMLEAGPASASASTFSAAGQSTFAGSGLGSAAPGSEADFVRDNQRRRDGEREREYTMSGGLGRREDGGY
jgi:hypothetical protein